MRVAASLKGNTGIRVQKQIIRLQKTMAKDRPEPNFSENVVIVVFRRKENIFKENIGSKR
jgi:hypothetical protein